MDTDLDKPSLHPGLEIRLEVLANRIAELRRKIDTAQKGDRREALVDLAELGRRHKLLDDRLCRLNREGPCIAEDIKAGMETLADDLMGWVAEHMAWIDSGYRSAPRPKTPRLR